MRIPRLLLFLGAAIGLSLIWCGAMLIPHVTRVMILKAGQRGVFLFISMSALLAFLLRRPLLRDRGPERTTIMALGIPIMGTVIFISVIGFLEWLKPGVDPPATVGDGLFSLALVGVLAIVAIIWKAFYVIVPMGALTVYVMRRVGDVLWPELKPHEN